MNPIKNINGLEGSSNLMMWDVGWRRVGASLVCKGTRTLPKKRITNHQGGRTQGRHKCPWFCRLSQVFLEAWKSASSFHTTAHNLNDYSEGCTWRALDTGDLRIECPFATISTRYPQSNDHPQLFNLHSFLQYAVWPAVGPSHGHSSIYSSIPWLLIRWNNPCPSAAPCSMLHVAKFKFQLWYFSDFQMLLLHCMTSTSRYWA